MSETITPEVLPRNASMGSDGRAHHNKGFSFVATLEKCAAAERSEGAASSIASAGERGVELHKVLEDIVTDWANAVQAGPAKPLDAFTAGRIKGLSVPDIAAVNKVVSEIKPYFQPEPGMLFGTEERIDLRDEDGRIVSFGYYDLFLKLGRRVLLIDHKFVRKEVEAAERNRQGHCLAVAVWQTYAYVDDVIVLFTMPDCGSSLHEFNRQTDEIRLFSELMEIFIRSDRPYKVLQAGDHCVYCRHRYNCEAAVGTLKVMVTGVNPLAIPSSFSPHLIETAEDMAILRYWADTVLPVCEAIKEKSLEWAKAKQGIAADVNGQHVEYAVQSRGLPRQLAEPLKVWEEVKAWMPIEAFLSASKIGITNMSQVVVDLISARLLDEGKEPNAAKIDADFCQMLIDKGLLTKEEGRTWFLKRVKASAKKPRKKKGEAAAEEPPALPEGEVTPGVAQPAEPTP